MAFDPTAYYQSVINQANIFDVGTATNTSTYTQVGMPLSDQLALAAQDAAMKAVILQAQASMGLAEQQAQATDLNAYFAQQQMGFMQDYLRNQARSTITQGQDQLGKVRSSIAASGLTLSGTTNDVYRNEQRKVNQSLENVNRQGFGKLTDIQNQITNLRTQSSQIRSAAATQAELDLRLADISTHRFV